MALLSSQRFLPLFITQFLGAFNDNLLKNALVILITYYISVAHGHNAQVLVTIAAGVFILPFFLFSALAGQIADKFDRAKLARIIKLFEILIMILASVGFITHNVWFLLLVLFASGVHSTFFGPIKYALLPQHLQPNELLSGNAYIEGGTFLAILFGTITGGVLIIQDHGAYTVSLGLVFVAICGYFASHYIPPAPGPVPKLSISYNLINETIKIVRYSKVNPKVFTSILCISWFWFIGATFLAQMPTFAKNYLHTQAAVVTIFLTIFSVGIAVGAYICSKLLHGAIKSVYVPTAALGISLFIVDLYFSSIDKSFFNLHGLLSTAQFLHMPASWRIMLDLFLIAACGGIYIVPLYTIMQHSGDKNYLARIIAANNVFNALFMVLSALFVLAMLALKRTIPEVFVLIAAINIVVALFIRKFLNNN